VDLGNDFEDFLSMDYLGEVPPIVVPIQEVGKESGRKGDDVRHEEKMKGDEEFLGEGEKLFVVKSRGLKREGDVLKRECFVKLEPGEGEVEVYKCRLCRSVLRKERREGKEKLGEGGGGKGLSGVTRFKLCVFYTHIISCCPERVRSMSVKDLPGDKDCLHALKKFFASEGGASVEMKEKLEVVMGVKKEKAKKQVRGEVNEGEKRKEREDEVKFSVNQAAAPPTKKLKLSFTIPPPTSEVSGSSPSSSSSSSSSTPSPSSFCGTIVDITTAKQAKMLRGHMEKTYKKEVSFLIFSLFVLTLIFRLQPQLMQPILGR
jgi:hypothetical protein